MRYEPPELHPLVDEEIVEALGALAGTFETASRGLIYEHRPASMAAERLGTALKPILLEAGQGGGSAFERDVAVVLRRVAEAARGQTTGNRRVFLDLLARNIARAPDVADGQASEPGPPSRLIVP